MRNTRTFSARFAGMWPVVGVSCTEAPELARRHRPIYQSQISHFPFT
ncbi:hypothetical protein [Escherichia coli]|nr:hypothetical protein [Escherichia coli]MBA2220330.1 hypothetical protein [Escherichia coli]